MTDNRYSRQTLFPPFGEEGQARLRDARIAVVGCGALGTNIVNLLARAGVGYLRVIDRDIVELSNLHRQVLFDEDDAREGRPKAEAARLHAARINADVTVDARVADLTPRNAEDLLADAELLLDGTDNVETRYLVNDVAVKTARPWIYGGAVGSTAVAMAFVPGGPCLRCLWPDPPPPGALPTCDTAGVLPPAPALAASMQAAAAMRLIAAGDAPPYLLQWDVWDAEAARLRVPKRDDCPACAARNFAYLESGAASHAATLCGRNAVQISPPDAVTLDLDAVRARLAGVAEVRPRGLYIEAAVEGQTLLVFPDGRVIVKDTTDPARARTLVSRYIGY
ncbi:MAG: ThiF family adenylyltransferase [Deltaproteobacteria bacterium]|nr:ThiF family adenylyltransferase [Deltaproteobacteria bacterium]